MVGYLVPELVVPGMADTILSPQQVNILTLLEQGCTWAEAADELDTSLSNVEGQMAKVREKEQQARKNLAKNAYTLLLLDEGDHSPYLSTDERELLVDIVNRFGDG